jgi:uncharacterized protein YbjT (DUF2867 family)
MRVVVIGGTGHVGTYLVPRLVARGHEVVVFSRGQRRPYQPHAAWKGVVPMDQPRRPFGDYASKKAAIAAS